MKSKHLLLTLLMALLVPWAASAQTSLFSEDFENGSMPTGWTTDGSGSWTVGTGDYSSSTGAGNGTYNAMITHGTTSEATKLITPEIDLSSVASAELSFMHVQRSWGGDIDGLKVYYRTSTNSTWTKLVEYSSAYASWTTEEGIALPDLTSTYQIAFEHIDNYGYGVGIDYVNIVQGASCIKPTGLAVTLTPGDGTKATFSWTENGTATQWQLCLNGDETNLIEMTENPFTYTGLTAETPYTAKVRAYCDATEQSAWSNEVTFTPTNAYSITVNDGTSTNIYVPFYGYYGDSDANSQFIIPATDLGAMQWGTINAITFYGSSASATWTGAVFDIYFSEVNNTVFESAALVDWSELDSKVYTGSVSVVDNKMELTLTAPYQYMGGNLLIGFDETSNSSNYPQMPWYGVTQTTNTTVYKYSSQNAVLAQFLPKVTFSYTPGEEPDCYMPTGLTVSYTGGTEATISWTSEATAWNIDVNGTVTAITQNPYTLTGLELATNYEVKVQADCGDSQSDWTNAVSFTTDLCMPENQCEISYSFTDQYNDSWNGAYMNIVDATTGSVLYQLTMPNEAGPYTGSFAVCDGRDIQFVWVSGSYPNECGYTFTDINGETILEKATATTAPSAGVVLTYTVNCTVTNCKKPTNFAASEVGPRSAKLSWTENGEATAWVVAYKEATATDFTEVNASTNPFTLEGLTTETAYTVKVKPECDVEKWSDEISFTTTEACPAPTGLAASNITAHTADLTWTGLSESYILSYRTAAYVDGIEEGFTTDPTGWIKRTGELNTDGTATLTGTSSWSTGTNNNVFNRHAYMNLYSTKNYWYITPSMAINKGDALSFDLAYTAYSGNNVAPNTGCTTHRFAVLISTDEMATWTILREWNNSGSAYVLDEVSPNGQNSGNIDLSAYAGETAYIAFFGHSETNSYDNNFHFDNVTIGTPVAAGAWQTVTTEEATAQLTGLVAETPYEVKVQGDCGTDGMSTESTIITFTTDIACPAPTGFAVNTLKSDHVILNWADGADAWQIQINDATTYADVTAADVTINEGIVTYTLEGLTENTAYTLKLRANCGDEDGFSAWTSALSFTTLEACPTPTNVTVNNIGHYSATVEWTGDSESFTVKYRTAATMNLDGINEGFEDGAMPTGWTIEGPGSWTVGTGDYNATTGAHGGSYNAKITHSNDGNETYLVTPNLDLSGQSGLNVNLWYINRSWAGDTDGFGVYYRINGGEWNEIFATTEAHSTWTELNEELPAGAYAANVQFGFKMTDGYGYGVAIDDITIGEPSSNPAGEWMSVEANDSPANLNGLAINTKYEVKVIPACDATVESDIVNFTTVSENEKYFITEGNWGTAANWEPAGVPTIEQTVELRANATITGEAFAKSISQGNYTITIEDGAKLKHLNSGVVATVKKNISGYENYTGENNGGYYLIANPMTSSVTPSADNGFLIGNFDLYNWNYNDINNEDNEWINFEAPNSSFTSLYSGAYGYLYANETGTTLTYTGNINAYTGNKGRSASLATNPDSYDFPSWYLFGNPYLYDAYLTNGSTNGTAMAYYRMNEAGDRIVPATAGTPIAPMEGFFYQGVTGATYVYVVTSEPAIASKAELLMTVSKGRSTEDNAIIVFGGNQSLGKMSFRANSTKLYMPVDNKDYAIVSTESNVGEMPVSFKAENNGTYTLSFSSQEVSFSYLHLIDNMTGNDVNLLKTPSYTFDARTTDYASRFRLVFATGSSAEGDNFGFVNASGNLCIFGIEGEATLQVVDMLGHVISSNQFSGSYEQKLNVAPSVYMLRLINGNDVKVQKMVIK